MLVLPTERLPKGSIGPCSFLVGMSTEMKYYTVITDTCVLRVRAKNEARLKRALFASGYTVVGIEEDKVEE